MSSWAEPTFLALIFAFGASAGSFVNVVAYRLPLGRSLSRPASACPACGTPVRWRHNLPVVGWLSLRGRCYDCSTPISGRYPLVELTAGLLAVAIWLLHSGPLVMPARIEQLLPQVVIPFVLQLTFAMALLALALMDLDWFLLPDRVTPLTLLGLMASLAIWRQTGVDLERAAIGALIGGGAPLVIGALYGLLSGRSGLGGGDWKLLLAIGAWLGPYSLGFVLAAGSLQGLAAALLFRREFALAELPTLPGEQLDAADSQGDTELSFGRLHVPFGPFLALAAIEWLLFGTELSRILGWGR